MHGDESEIDETEVGQMYKGIKKLAELILESEEKFLTGQDEQEICLGSILNAATKDEIWVSEDGEYHTVMIGNKTAQESSMQVCHESEHPICLPKLLWIANALQKLLDQANGNLPIEEDENPDLIRYAAAIIRKYADGLSHDERSAKEICAENKIHIA